MFNIYRRRRKYNNIVTMNYTVVVTICILMAVYFEQHGATYQLSTIPESAVENEDLTFVCRYGQALTSFTRDDKPICLINGIIQNNTCNLAGSYNTSFRYVCDSSTYNVTIPGQFLTEKLHTTNWKCLSPLNDSQTSSKTLYINVPITTVTLSSSPTEESPVKIIKGETELFICRTNAGRPSSTIQWYLSNVNITSSATSQPDACATDCSDDKLISSSQLKYKGNISDSGKKIHCTALNIQGRGVRSFDTTIDVLYSPSKPSITQTPPAPVDENTTLTLLCEIKGGNPPANITWECDRSISIDSTDRNGTSVSKIQFKLTREINRKECKCIGLHPVWTEPNSTSFVLNIRYAPSLPSITQNPSGPVIEGKTVKLTCEISGGNPLANITWMCDSLTYNILTNGSFIDRTVSIIELNVTRENDGKNCMCRGEHPLWTDQKEVTRTLIVYFKPDKYPQVIQVPAGPVDEGTQIKLICEVPGGKPLAVISWQCNGSSQVDPQPRQPIDKTVSTIELIVLRQQHGENCTCISFHPAWIHNTSSSKKLAVLYSPDSFPNITQTQSGPIVEENKVILTCKINGGNPLATIAWHCDGFTPVESTGTILLDKVVASIEKNVLRKDDAKTCTCTGHHRLWTPDKQTRSHTLHVYYSSTIQIMNQLPINVVENRTIDLKCTEVDGNPRNSSFEWYKQNKLIGNRSTYSIKGVIVNAGNYTCRGSNGFGNQSEAVSEVHVLYSPRVSTMFPLYGPTIDENGTAVLQCTVQSYPSPDIIWMENDRDAVAHRNGNQFQRNLTIEMANCFDTNNYTCKATNSIGSIEYTTTKDIELFVNCYPRRYDQQEESTNIIGLAVGQNLTILEHILAYPIYHITWTFKQTLNSSENVTLSDSDCSTNKIFDHHICFSRQNLTENDFGLYSAIIVNDIGNATLSFMVNPQEKPYISTDVNVTCGTLKAEVSWITAYNGGQQQRFYVITTNKDGLQLIHNTHKFGNKKGVIHRLSLPMPAGPFSFAVFGNNSFGNATAKGASCEVQDVIEKDSVLGLAAGLGSSMAVLLIIIVAAVIFFRKRISKKKGDDTTLFKRSKNKTNEDDDDTLADNPLYVTSEIHDDGGNGQVYSKVDKTKKRGLEKPVSFKVDNHGPIYSEVQKNGKKGKEDASGKKIARKEKKGKTSTELEMGNVYGNADSILQDNNDDGVYANAENTSKSSNKLFIPKKNKDGLIYADLELNNCPTGSKFVIRGLENRTNYAIIDLNVKVDPLPSDDDDKEDGDQEQHTDNGQNN